MGRTCTVEDLKTNALGVLETVTASKEPVFIDQGGKSQVALVDVETYLTQMQALGEFKRIFAANATEQETAESPAKIKAPEGWGRR